MHLFAQNDFETIEAYRPKVAEFGVEGIWNYQSDYTSERSTNYQDEVERDLLLKFKIAAPLIMKKGKLLAAQFKYYEHRFDFDFDNIASRGELFSHLDRQKIMNGGLRMLYQTSTDGTKVTLAGGAEFKSDEVKWNRNSTKYFVSGLHQWNLTERKSIATGVVVNYDLGILNAYPVLIYENQINDKWALELSLPKSVSVRRRINNANYLIAKTQFKGWRYNLTNSISDENTDLTIRRADILFTLSWEHEIHDWLWFGVDAGYIKNVRHYLTNPGDRRADALANFNTQDAKFFKLSIFLVPPRRFFK